MQTSTAVAGALAELRALLGARASDADAVREHHSHGESYHPPAAPDIVCFPASTAEVSEIARISQRFQLPIVPFGAGTSLEGHVHALRGGISLDLREMNRVLRISDADLDVDRGSRRDPPSAGAGPAQHRPHVPHRPRRGRDARRDGRNARLRHDRGSLRHDARERARPHGRPRRRQDHQDRNARAKVCGGLRPDASLRRLRRHARHHHRGDAPAASGARSRVRGGLLVSHDAGRRRHGDRHHPARRAGRAHRAARRNPDGRDQPLLEDWNTRSRQRCCSSSTATARITSRGRRRPSRRWRWNAAAAASNGRRGSRIASGSGRRATTHTTPAWHCVQAAAPGRPMSASPSPGSPTASSRPRRKRGTRLSRSVSSATPATATST